MSRLQQTSQPRYLTSGFGNFGNFGLSNQLNGLNGLVLKETPRILDRTYRNDLLGAVKDVQGAFGIGGGSGSSSSSTGPVNTDGYDKLKDEMLGLIGQQGQSRTNEINQAFDASLDSSIANLYDRGWGNSTAIESQTNANNRGRQSALTELGDSLLSQKIGTGTQIGLAGLNAQTNQRNMNSQFQYNLLNGLFGGLFG